MQRSLFLLFFFISLYATAQQGVHLFVDGVYAEKKAVKDTLAIKNYVQNLVYDFVGQGYYFAGLDSAVKSAIGTEIYLHKGEKFEEQVTNSKGRNLIKNTSKRIMYLGDNGYPFASIKMDSIGLDSGHLTGALVEDKGPLIRNDSCFFFNEVKTSHQFIYQLLDHVPGEVFSESNYRSISQKIDRSSFLSFGRPADISFQDEKARLYLDIQESEAGSFQGVLGLQQTTLGKSEVVGSFDLVVQNLFKSGKEFEIQWERFRENSQELSISYSHPFVFGSRITPSFTFDLLKQDTTFLQRNSGVGLSIYISPKTALYFQYAKRAGTLLTTNDQLLINSDLADFEINLYQLKLKRGTFRDLRKLTAGLAWEATVGLGAKTIERNLSLADSFYDTLSLETDIFHFDFRSVINFRVAKRQLISQQLALGIFQNDELLNNERFRLGGLTSLRGFDEKSIFADQYLLSRTEFRSFFEKGSFLFVFYDQLLFRNDSFSDAPLGSGLGFSLATLSGQFSFALAIGKSKTQKVDLSRMKAHFGYITRF